MDGGTIGVHLPLFAALTFANWLTILIRFKINGGVRRRELKGLDEPFVPTCVCDGCQPIAFVCSPQ
jgi:hypothetical protein